MLYIHIPFCKSRCIYCAFHSGIDRSLQEQYVAALQQEIRLQKDFLPSKILHSIYFGGGTPSLLTYNQFQQLFHTIAQYFIIDQDAEITIECNPDDVTPQLAAQLAALGVNRVSIGVQSLNNQELALLRRRHTATQAIDAIKQFHQHGIHNISIDLMFGLPSQTLSSWEQTLQTAFSLNISHLSAYNLSIEENTALSAMIQQGTLQECSEDNQITMFRMLCQKAKESDFQHYEISNFCKANQYSRHNTAYWNNVPYLGIGAAAHSFNGNSRFWNIADTKRYCESLLNEHLCHEQECLSFNEKYNEMIFTSLRTSNGLNLTLLEQRFGVERRNYCLNEAKKHLERGVLTLKEDTLKLTFEGILISNDIMSDLCYIDD
ncbi:MAG: radical SAM family heme chaperone HemW [Bacteroidales bacterium]|nr:radical SAM family heme chaperone HemW [Bacteroidales bacterium]